MFKIGDCVICGSKGVCNIEDITTLSMTGVDEEREYFILKPRFATASTVYVPVDTSEDSLRSILTKEKAEELIRGIHKIPPIPVTNEKMLEQEYRACMKANQSEEWAKVIKTIFMRKRKRNEAGRKVTAVDAKYSKLAEDNLYGELAVALDIPKESVETFVTVKMGGDLPSAAKEQ